MNESDEKSYKIKSFFNTIKYYLAKIEPGLVSVFQTILYWTIKISTSIVKTSIRMIMGKEV